MTFTKVGTYKGPIFSVQNVSSGQNKVSTWLFYYFTLFVGSSFFVCMYVYEKRFYADPVPPMEMALKYWISHLFGRQLLLLYV